MNIIVWNNFSKRRNSTKRPGAGGVTKSVVLKEETSIEQPSFILKEPIANYTYVYAFNRYYFVTDVVNLDGSRCEIVCDLDVLATYKDDITGYTAFVERSASNYDTLIPDGLLSQTVDVVSTSVAGSETTLDSYGTYVVPLSGYTGLQLCCFNNLTSAGYFLNGRQVKKPGNGQLPSVNELDNLLTTVGYQFFNIQDYMGSMYWLPLSYATIVGASTTLSAGMFDTGISVNLLDLYEYTITGALNMPSNYYSDFRAGDPRFSKYTMWLPGIGTVPLNSIDASENDLYFDMMIDCVSGKINYRIYHASGSDVASFASTIGIPVPFGSAKYDWTAPISETLSGVTQGALSGGGGGAIAGGVIGFVHGVEKFMEPQVSLSAPGGNRGVIQDRPDIYVSVENYGAKEFPTVEIGRPLMQNVALSSLSGYVKCGNASVPLAGHEGDMAAVNNYLNSGFYIE